MLSPKKLVEKLFEGKLFEGRPSGIPEAYREDDFLLV